MKPQTRFERWAPALLIATVFVVYFLVSHPAAAPAGWSDDYAGALREAGATQRHVVIDFYSDGCPPCAAMDRTVLGTPAIREALLGYVPVRVDVNREREAAGRHQVFATPTFVVLDRAGRELARREGYQSVEEFVAFLKDHAPLGATRPASVAPSASAAP